MHRAPRGAVDASKQWEFCTILERLDQHGVLGPGHRGIGFGVGREPLAAVMADRGVEVLATDLPPDAPDSRLWSESGQHATEVALNDRGICPPDRFAELVRFREVDMRDLPDDLGSFDFSWSSCVVEHLGSIDAGLDFLVEHLRLLRPGGIAVHTLEFNASSDRLTRRRGATSIFRRRDLESLVPRLRQVGATVELTWHLGTRPLDRHVDRPPYSTDRHLKLELARFVTTSYALAVRTGDRTS